MVEGFHWRDDWYFKRMDNGDVEIQNTRLNLCMVVPNAEWCSIIAQVSALGEETAGKFQDAEACCM